MNDRPPAEAAYKKKPSVCLLTGLTALTRQAFRPGKRLIKRNTDTFFFSPNDMTAPFQLIARHKEREAVWDEERSHDFKRRAGVRDVLHDVARRDALPLDLMNQGNLSFL